ncbi:MAG TPA: RES domain-containing protein [Thermoanaerobaculia bacterium]
MKVWRLCKRRHAAFDGEGARLAGGRWNPRGVAVVYASESLALAALELLVHADPALLPKDLVAIPAEIPDALRVGRVDETALGRDWRRHPAPESLSRLGAEWLERRETVALSVPSAVVPRERNVLLNPAHPDFRHVRVGAPDAFSFDPRLTSSR